MAPDTADAVSSVNGDEAKARQRVTLSLKLRSVRLKIKKLKIQNAWSDLDVEDDLVGIDLLLEENELIQHLQELCPTVGNVAEAHDATSVSLTAQANLTDPAIPWRDGVNVAAQAVHSTSAPTLPPSLIDEQRTTANIESLANQNGSLAPNQQPLDVELGATFVSQSADAFRQRSCATTLLNNGSFTPYTDSSSACDTRLVSAGGQESFQVNAGLPTPAISSIYIPPLVDIDWINNNGNYTGGQSHEYSSNDFDQQTALLSTPTHALGLDQRHVNVYSEPQNAGSCADLQQQALELIGQSGGPTIPSTRLSTYPQPRADEAALGSLSSATSLQVQPRRTTLGGQSTVQERNALTNVVSRVRKQKKRGPFKTRALRESTACRRNLGSCERCRTNKKRCDINPLDPRGPCLSCLQAQFVCINWKVGEVSLFRDQSSTWPTWTNRFKDLDHATDIQDWASSEVKILSLRHLNPWNGDRVQSSYAIRVRQFIPEDGDMLFQDWFDAAGIRKIHPIRPYAVENLEDLHNEKENYIARSICAFISSLVGKMDELIWQTYTLACKRTSQTNIPQDERQLLHKTLRLWVCSRCASLPEEIIGETDLASKINDPSSPYHNTLPVAPVIYAQEEVVNHIKIQRPLQKQVLAELIEMMKQKGKGKWFTLYLTLFILAHSCSMTSQRDAEYAREVRKTTLFANPDPIDANQKGIQTLILQFRDRNKGHIPFAMALDQDQVIELKQSAKLDDEQLRLVIDTAQYAKQSPGRILSKRESLDRSTDNHYFIRHLYSQQEPCW